MAAAEEMWLRNLLLTRLLYPLLHMRKVAVFVNPLLSNKRAARAAAMRIEALLRGRGLEVSIRELGTIPEAAELARRATEDGCDTVFSCGGDGTAFALLQSLAGSGVALGILPMGTGNVLAQNMRLPRDPVGAAKALLNGGTRNIPLGRLTTITDGGLESSWYFAMSAGIGAHATLLRQAERWGKHISGRAAYFLAGAALLLRHRIECFELEITIAGGKTLTWQASEALAVRVAEVNIWRPGGDLHTPMLRLASVAAKSRLQLGRASIGALLRGSAPEMSDKEAVGGVDGPGYSVKYHDITRLVCRPIAGRGYRAAPLVQADGEVLGASNAVITMADKRLTLLWPKD
ncbi:MAG TPA: diacylglycerol kinase family protein [Acidisarcina sp.]